MSFDFKGYSWEELAECWGINVGYEYLDVAENTVEVKELLKSPETIDITQYINGSKIVFTINDKTEVLAEKVRRHILSNIEIETGRFIDKQIRLDLNCFLKALIKQSAKIDHCYPIYEGMLAIENDYTFARWICNNLEELWS